MSGRHDLLVRLWTAAQTRMTTDPDIAILLVDARDAVRDLMIELDAARRVDEAEAAEYLELAARADGELQHHPRDWGTTARNVMRAAAAAFRRLAAQGPKP